MGQRFAEQLREKTGFICDMDGVIYHGNRVLPGAREFVEWLQREEKRFLFLTNSSERSPRDLQRKLDGLGISVDEEHFYTSALATAEFLTSQVLGKAQKNAVYIIGEAGLVSALTEAGLRETDTDAEFVVVGETRSYGFDKIERAVNLVRQGARLIGTNPDISGPTEHGIAPGCGALIAPIEMVTERKAYFVGKPNPLMMRQALHKLGCRREETFIIGDRMDTDIVAGMESEIDTILTLSGVTEERTLADFAYQPHFIVNGIGDVAHVAEERV